MLLDAAVHAALNTLKTGVLEGGVQLSPAVAKKDEPGYQDAVAITEFCTTVLDDLQIDLESVLWDLTDAFALGNRLAEQVYEPRSVNGKSALALSALKPRPRETYAFVTDAYANVIGVMGLIPGMAFSVLPGLVVGDPRQIPNLLPREKFCVLAVNPRNSDPRGTSLLRPAYKAWWQKMQLWGEYLKYLTQFASPIVVGIASPQAISTPGGMPAPPAPAGPPPSGYYVPPSTPAPTDPVGKLLTALQQVRNGGCLALPNGFEVRIERASGNGEAFLQAMDLLDRQITTAILNQTLATMEARHMARAASETHQDVLETMISRLKQLVIRLLRKEILTPLVKWNFSEQAARELVPCVALGEEPGIDKPALLTAYTGAGYGLDPSQFIGIDEELGAPERDPATIKAQQEVRAAQQDAAVKAAKNPQPQQTNGHGQAPQQGAGRPTPPPTAREAA